MNKLLNDYMCLSINELREIIYKELDNKSIDYFYDKYGIETINELLCF